MWISGRCGFRDCFGFGFALSVNVMCVCGFGTLFVSVSVRLSVFVAQGFIAQALCHLCSVSYRVSLYFCANSFAVACVYPFYDAVEIEGQRP